MEPPTGTNEGLLVAVVGSNRDQMSLLAPDIELAVGPRTKDSLVSALMMGGTNAKDQRPFV